MKLLLVEDNPMNRDMLTRRLLRRGFEVVIAVNGDDALAIAKDVRPDLVLMDMSLPVLDGWETTRRLKSMPETNQIPVIALTAHALAGDYQRAISAGCDDYETKPIDFERLIAKIQKLHDVDMAKGT